MNQNIVREAVLKLGGVGTNFSQRDGNVGGLAGGYAINHCILATVLPVRPINKVKMGLAYISELHLNSSRKGHMCNGDPHLVKRLRG